MADVEDEYKFDAFDDGETKRTAGEQGLRKLRDFVHDYEGQLRDIEDALAESLSAVWDHATDPVALFVAPHEDATILDLVKTDNKLFNKIVVVFGTLVSEMRDLAAMAPDRFFAPLTLFAENVTEELEEGDAQLYVGRTLSLLLDLSQYINRVYTVVRNVVHQLASLYHPTQKMYASSFKAIHLRLVWETLGSLLTVLITLDEIFAQNMLLKEAWGMYKRMMKTIRLDQARYGVQEDKLRQFEKLVLSLEGQLFEGLIYQNCVEQEFDFPGLVEVRSNKAVRKEFLDNIKIYFNYLNSKIGEPSEVDQRTDFVGLCALYAFYFHLFQDLGDKKLFKMVWDMHKRTPLVHLFGHIVWFPTDFILQKIQQVGRQVDASDVGKFRKAFVANLGKGLQNDVRILYLQVCTWMVRIESNLSQKSNVHEIVSTRMTLFIQGVVLGHKSSNLIKTALHMHSKLGIGMRKGLVVALCQCAEILKAIRATFHRRSTIIAEDLPFMIQQVSETLVARFKPVQAFLVSRKKMTDAQLDVLSSVNLLLEMLNGTGTYNRRIIIHIAMDVVHQLNILKDNEWEEAQKALRKLDLICQLQERIERSTDCGFLYWSRDLVPTFFADVFDHPDQAHKLQYIMAALHDPCHLLEKATHCGEDDTLLSAYQKEIEDALFAHVIKPLCREIENDLRLHIHSHLKVSDRNPLKNGVQLSDLSRFLKLRPLRFFGRSLDLRAHVSHYLDTTFYNLTTVALHDWKTYEEMRSLAQQKYGLELVDVHLPGATLEQGLDVLEIMRNIHIFVARYNYNLNNQIFVESTSNAKHLNTINIRHVANSIRTHGTGIINTTVNFAYQFLRQKFVIFSQFLFDDHIKSRNIKDLHWFKANRDEFNNRFPYERADKFNREIRKLGVNSDGMTYLDQFRKLITEIGNALGYVRMVRAGGQHHVSGAIKFVPDLGKVISFEDAAKEDELSEESIVAGRNLDAVLQNMSDRFAEGTQYFKLLVEVFSESFRNPKNMHLRYFFIMIPALTLNFVEHMMMSKEKLSKKGKDGASFTDDGFAMGMAYILKLLDQNYQYDSLHWFEVVKLHYAGEIRKVEASMGKVRRRDDEQAQTMILSKKKLEQYALEVELLFYSLSGARIFFRD